MFPFFSLHLLLLVLLQLTVITAQFDRPPQSVIIRSATERPDRPNLLNPQHPDITQSSYIRFQLRDDRAVNADKIGVQYIDSKGYARNSTCYFVDQVDEGHTEDVVFVFANDESFLHPCGLQYGVAVVCANETATCTDIDIKDFSP